MAQRTPLSPQVLLSQIQKARRTCAMTVRTEGFQRTLPLGVRLRHGCVWRPCLALPERKEGMLFPAKI